MGKFGRMKKLRKRMKREFERRKRGNYRQGEHAVSWKKSEVKTRNYGEIRVVNLIRNRYQQNEEKKYEDNVGRDYSTREDSIDSVVEQ